MHLFRGWRVSALYRLAHVRARVGINPQEFLRRQQSSEADVNLFMVLDCLRCEYYVMVHWYIPRWDCGIGLHMLARACDIAFASPITIEEDTSLHMK